MSRKSAHWANGFGLFCMFLFVILAFLVDGRVIASYDWRIISWIQGWESDFMTSIWSAYTVLGTMYIGMLLTIMIISYLYVVLGLREQLLLIVWAVCGSWILNSLLKNLFHRDRPNYYRIIQESGYSFPSGHSMSIFTLCGVLAYVVWRHMSSTRSRIVVVICYSLIVLAMGVSRIYLGVHYPSDVLGGYLASAAWLCFTIGFVEKHQLLKS